MLDVSVRKSAYCMRKWSLLWKPASRAQFKLSSTLLAWRMRARYLTVCSSMGETTGGGGCG